MDTDQEQETHVLATYDEVRVRFGLGSTDAARMKAKRRKWQSEISNRPGGLTVVRVPQSEWDMAEAPERSGSNQPEQSPSDRDREAIIAIIMGERDRLLTERDRLIGERDRAQADASKLRGEKEEARVQAAKAEGEAKTLRAELEGVKATLEEARRTLWRRLFG